MWLCDAVLASFALGSDAREDPEILHEKCVCSTLGQPLHVSFMTCFRSVLVQVEALT